MVDQFINEVTSKLYGQISEEDLEKVRRALSISFSGYELQKKETALQPYTGWIPESLKAFLVTKKIEGKSDKTLSLYKAYLEDMFNTLQTPVREITPNMLKVYLYHLQDSRGMSNRTLDTHRSVMSSYFSWSAAEGYIDRNPMINIKTIKYEVTERKPLTGTELELVRQACKDIREQAIIEFLYSTGCRVTEMERVNKGDVDFANGEVKLFGKGNKHRSSYLSAKAMLLLRQYLDTRSDGNEALFVYTKIPHGRLKKSGIEKIVSQIGDRAGVDRLHPHLIRHTTATNCLQRGMDVTQLKELLGHSSLDTTMIYAKVNREDVKRSHEKFIA